ncbi:MAG TPA: serine hydrolase domain-containing protein [Gemmatimonadaceae bacterium]|nr:serine hydrolase domain-containing protein [Gemmatimonadaceae bacterium]
MISSAGTRYANDSFKALDSAIRSEARAGFSGIVLIGDSSNILFSQGCGSAKIADTVAADLPFWLASNSKQVAAAVIMRLQDRGKLRVTDSITRFFRAVPPDKQSITLHQLLTHTAGFPHEYRADGIVERDRAVTEILALKSVGKPGEKFSYSNDGYSLLAAVVEIASGVPFDKYVQDSMFRASGLERSGVWGHERADIPVAPVADAKQLLKQRPNIHASGKSVANWGYRGPTGVYSSARDVYQWLTALRSGKVITPEAFRQLVGRHVPVRTDSAGSSYTAYGWGVRVEGDRDRWYAHSGNEDWLGHNSVIRFTPNGYVVVVLSNSGDVGEVGWATRVNRVVREVMSASM